MPGPEDPLRRALERMAPPADPAAAYERIVEKKIRRRIMRQAQVISLAVIVVAATVGGSFALVQAFRGSPAPRRPLTGPTPTSLPGPVQPSPTASSPPAAPDCDAQSVTNGDFDGNGRPDTATVCAVGDGTFSLDVRWPGAATGTFDLSECQDVCRGVAAADLDGNGTQEFVLLVAEGASTSFVEVYELFPSEACCPAASVNDPGAPGFPAGKPAVFPTGGSVTHLDFMTCVPGTDQVIATSAKLNHDQTRWAVHETVLAFSAVEDFSHFDVVSFADLDPVPFDPTGQSQPQPRGQPCWQPGPPPAPPTPGPSSVP